MYNETMLLSEIKKLGIRHIIANSATYIGDGVVRLNGGFGDDPEVTFSRTGFGRIYDITRYSKDDEELASIKYGDYTAIYDKWSEDKTIIDALNSDIKTVEVVTKLTDEDLYEFKEEAKAKYALSELEMTSVIDGLSDAIGEKPIAFHIRNDQVVGISRNYDVRNVDVEIVNLLSSRKLLPRLVNFKVTEEVTEYDLKFSDGESKNVLMTLRNGFTGRNSLSVNLKFIFDGGKGQVYDYSIPLSDKNKHQSALPKLLTSISSYLDALREAHVESILTSVNGVGLAQIAIEMIEDELYNQSKYEKKIDKLEELADVMYGENGEEALANLHEDYAEKHGYKRVFKDFMDLLLEHIVLKELNTLEMY